MEDCTGGDLSGYLKRRGRIEGLQYIPEPGAAPTYYPHPRSGGLDVIAVRSFLRQMGASPVSFDLYIECWLTCSSSGTQVSSPA